MTKGGVRLDVLLNATTRRDEQGNVIGVVGTCLLSFECICVCVIGEQGIHILHHHAHIIIWLFLFHSTRYWTGCKYTF
jgi:hypothetical protein